MLLWALVCWGRIRHKRVLMLHVLCASAMIQLMFAPAQLFSASFQMTYGVMAAICGITAQTAPNAQKKRGWKGKMLSLLSGSGDLLGEWESYSLLAAFEAECQEFILKKQQYHLYE